MWRACRAGLFGLALLLIPPSLPAFSQGAELAPGSIARVVGQTGGRANVRSSPAIQSDNVVGALDVGTEATIQELGVGDQQAWLRVVAANGMAGWVHRSLLRLDPEATAASLQRSQQQAQPVVAAPQPAPEAAPVAPPPEPAADTGATAAEPAEPTLANDWTTEVPKLIGAITSCAEVPSIKPVVVTRAYYVDPNMAGVRMEDTAGRRWECLILRRGGYPIRYEPIAPGQRRMPGDGNPVFVLAPGEPPQDSCHKSDEIKDEPSGILLGWRVQVLC